MTMHEHPPGTVNEYQAPLPEVDGTLVQLLLLIDRYKGSQRQLIGHLQQVSVQLEQTRQELELEKRENDFLREQLEQFQQANQDAKDPPAAPLPAAGAPFTPPPPQVREEAAP